MIASSEESTMEATRAGESQSFRLGSRFDFLAGGRSFRLTFFGKLVLLGEIGRLAEA
jgi:hypothetical protein